MELVCIACPNGCKLSIDKQGETLIVSGNKCPKGETFAKEEILAPKRSVTTTVKTVFKALPVVPVRTEGDIPKEKIFDFISLSKTVVLDRPYDMGEVILPALFGTDINLICSVDMNRLLGGKLNG